MTAAFAIAAEAPQIATAPTRQDTEPVSIAQQPREHCFRVCDFPHPKRFQ
jgi:hypothetical protein